ncbi:MAG: nuclear transport factor 2 family protein [Gammaproteobacteria bacterium]|nr:nuclear transport factor 2 family protein [Gammaproteobacteria bacterium]
MTDRAQIEQLVRELHAARLEDNLERLCALYSAEARLRIAGSSDGKPIAMAAIGIAEIRPWLSILVKTFRMTQYTILALTVEVPRAAAHWRVDIHSKITGAVVPTELVDLLDVRAGRIASHTEFFVPC